MHLFYSIFDKNCYEYFRFSFSKDQTRQDRTDFDYRCVGLVVADCYFVDYFVDYFQDYPPLLGEEPPLVDALSGYPSNGSQPFGKVLCGYASDLWIVILVIASGLNTAGFS